jgi:hypothetical protein
MWMMPLSARAAEATLAVATAIIAINAARNPAERIFLPLRPGEERMGAAPTGGLGAGAITVYGVGDENADAHDAEKRGECFEHDN